MDQAPQLAASAMSGMKGSKPREYQEKYNEEIDKHKKEIEADPKISAAQKVELVLRLDNPDPKKPGIRQQFNRSASRYVEGIATGGGGGGGSPAPGH